MRRTKKLLVQLSIVALFAAAFLVKAPAAHALSGSQFNPGRIIDDSVFFNPNTMSVGDIQNFLYSKSGPCDTNRPTTDSRYQPPWTCLYQYRENTSTKATNIGSPGSNPAGSISGAQIIYDAAQTYGINPKALIVLIQKESSLITDNWPWSNQYRTATGYGCPDTAACDTQYYGFYNQVNRAAFQFRRYATYPNEYNYKAGRNNNIGYNPNAGCGYQTVYIQNQATAGLYNYTPYVPNAAALNNLYGTGDGCSAYGNRNFWRLYSDWFGSTYGVPYQAAFAGQSDYPTLGAGQSTSSYVKYKNTGNTAWYDDTSASSGPAGTLPTHLSTDSPVNRTSQFGSSWTGGANRPALNFAAVYEADGTTLAGNQHIVQVGQIAKFSFNFTAPSSIGAGTYREYLRPVLEGSPDGAFNFDGVWLDITIDSIYSTTSPSKGSNLNLRPTESGTSSINYKNTGNVTWYDDISVLGAPVGSLPVHLATANATNRSSVFGSTWTSPSRPALNFEAVYEADGTTLASDQHAVRANQIGKFNTTFTPPAQKAAGTYREYFRPVVEGSPDGELNDPGTYLDVAVASTVAGASTQGSTAISLTPGANTTLSTQFTNVGNTTWSRGTVYLKPDGASSTALFKDSTWAASDNVIAMTEASVAPGSTGSFTAHITAPAQPGTYTISFAPGTSASSFGSPNAQYVVTVAPPQYTASFAGQSDYATLAPGASAAAYIKYKNTGNVAWYDDTSQSSGPAGTLPTHLATGSPTNRTSPFSSTWASGNRPVVNFAAVYEANGTTLAGNQHVVQPGQIAKFGFTFSAPAGMSGGTRSEHFLPVVEGTTDGAFSYPDVWLDVTVR